MFINYKHKTYALAQTFKASARALDLSCASGLTLRHLTESATLTLTHATRRSLGLVTQSETLTITLAITLIRLRESLRRCVRYVLGNTLVMSNWERVSEFDYADDGGLIDTRKCAFAPTIGPNKDGHTHIR